MAKKNFLSFEEARTIVHSLNLRGIEWRHYNGPDSPFRGIIPVHPDRAYKGKGWVDWTDWFGNRTRVSAFKWKPFKEARAFARGLKLSGVGEWRAYYKTAIRPQNIPTDPSRIYKDLGWAGWRDFLGNTGKRGTRLIKIRPRRRIVRAVKEETFAERSREMNDSKILSGFVKFSADGAEAPSEEEFVSVHRGEAVQVSKALFSRLGLGRRRFYAELHYSPEAKAIAMKFTAGSGPSRVRVGISRNIAAAVFCRHFKIPDHGQTRLPVAVYKKNLIVTAKLRTDGAVAAAKRSWSKREPSRRRLLEEVGKLLREVPAGFTMRGALEALLVRSVLTTKDVLDVQIRGRVSEVLSSMVRRLGRARVTGVKDGAKVYQAVPVTPVQ